MHTFILAMVLYTHVLLQLQEEMDRVTKKERLPTDEDQPDLPYLNAVLKEVIRWAAETADCYIGAHFLRQMEPPCTIWNSSSTDGGRLLPRVLYSLRGNSAC